MKCDELKHQLMLNKERSWVPCYIKSEADREIRHQKYKRCLAMVMWCKAQMVRYIDSCDRYGSNYVNKKADHYNKWSYEWMELAEKFKELKNAED